jgi:TolB protein
MVAFNSDRAGDMNIWLFTLADSSTRQLTTGHGGDFQGNWSPDENKIAFFSSRSGSPNIWVVEIASGTLRASDVELRREREPVLLARGHIHCLPVGPERSA